MIKKISLIALTAFAVFACSGCISHKTPVRQYVLPSYCGVAPMSCLEVTMPEYLDNRSFVQINSVTGEVVARNGAMWNVAFPRMVKSALATKLGGCKKAECNGKLKLEFAHFALAQSGKLVVDGVITRTNAAGESTTQQFAFEVAPEKASDVYAGIVAQYEKALTQLAAVLSEK